MDIQVGDRVTYRYYDYFYNKELEIVKLITDETCLNTDYDIKIIKIERPHYEVVEEKKELLTEEEREFLKQCRKINNSINYIQRFEDKTYLINEDNNKNVFILNDIHKNLFKKLENGYGYTLKELGLEEN